MSEDPNSPEAAVGDAIGCGCGCYVMLTGGLIACMSLLWIFRGDIFEGIIGLLVGAMLIFGPGKELFGD